MDKLIEAWRKKAILEDQQAKECFEEGFEIYSQGHSSAAMIYRHCADELERHLSEQSDPVDGKKLVGYYYPDYFDGKIPWDSDSGK